MDKQTSEILKNQSIKSDDNDQVDDKAAWIYWGGEEDEDQRQMIRTDGSNLF